MTIRRGEIVGVGGLQGQGQLALFLSLFGAIRSTGKVELRGKTVRLRHPRAALDAGIALIPEDRASDGLCMTLSVRDNISIGSLAQISNWGYVNRGKERTLLAFVVSQLNVAMRGLRQEVAALSGGNQQKVILGPADVRRHARRGRWDEGGDLSTDARTVRARHVDPLLFDRRRRACESVRPGRGPA